MINKFGLYILLIFFAQSINAQINQVDLSISDKLKLADMYYPRNGKIIDSAKAFKLYTECAEAGNARAFYKLGMMYKYGIATDVDFSKAYQFFCSSAKKNYPQGIYSQGYMLYKGLGCVQNYNEAYALFRKALSLGNTNAMRFVGICMQNGYGTDVNSDSAKYWLSKASRHGNKLADKVLAAEGPENDDVVGKLVTKIKSVKKASSKNSSVNQYKKVEYSIAANKIEGDYEGWLIQYDYSGQHISKVDKLNFNLVYLNDSLHGNWIENDTLIVPIHGILTQKALVFSKMEYTKKQPYSNSTAVPLAFQNASLQLTNENDDVYLSGNVQMYFTSEKEPTQPLQVILKRSLSGNNNTEIKYLNDDGSALVIKKLSVYPNPFTSTITLDFELKENDFVQTRLFTMEGKEVYKNTAGVLSKGNYTIAIKPQQITSGTYILQLQSGKNAKNVKVIKL